VYTYSSGTFKWIAASDFVASQGSVMPAANAAAASATDTFWVNQGGTALAVQTMAAVVTLTLNGLTSYKVPSVAVSGSILLDSASHNGKHVIFTGAGTVSPPASYASFGDGCSCDITNLSGSTVTFVTTTTANAGGIVSSGNATSLPNFGTVRVRSSTALGASGTIMVTLPGSATATQSATLVAPTGITPGATYAIAGSLSGYSAAPTLTISIDGAAFAALPTGSTVTASVVNLSMPGIASGTHTVQVKDTGTVQSNVVTFTVAAAAETITVTTPGSHTAGTAFTLAGTYTNGPPAALDYSLDGGSTWVAAASPTIASGAYSFSLTISSANASQTVKVRDHTATTTIGTSGSFVVSAAASGPANPNVVSFPYGAPPTTKTAAAYGSSANAQPGNYFALTTTGGAALIPGTAVVIAGWTNSTTVPPVAAATVGPYINTNGYQTCGNAGASNMFIDISNVTAPTGSGTVNYYFWASSNNGSTWSIYGGASPIACAVTF
jgi:hypothetical protein